jgi:CBS-domain-containing membrane protein
MFRTLGLRHLCVVNFRNEVLGIVTRIDLVSANYYQESSSVQLLRRKQSRKTKFSVKHDAFDLTSVSTCI